MSQSGPAPTKRSSQVPRSRGPRAGSNGSQQQDPNSEDNGLSRRQSNVTFGPGPTVSPDDSISRIKSRDTWPGPNTNSDRKGSRSAREAWNSYNRSQVSKTSSRNGTAWSGSGAALTENNLEQLNEANEKQKSSTGNSNQEPLSDQQEVPQGTQRGSRSRYGNGTQTNGGGRTNARSSRRNSKATNGGNTQAGGSKSQSRGTENNGSSGEVEREAGSASQSQSKQQTVTASKNVIDINTTAGSGSRSQSQSKQQTVAASRNVIDINNTSGGGSQSKGASQARSRRDSKMEESVQEAQTNAGSGSKALSRPSQPSKPPTAPMPPNEPCWERTTRTITRTFPNGKQVVERIITQKPIAAV